ncbi:MAG: molybdopterin molybdotransferase MoeA [Deltaproteobacteria bacterium]|nr:molybdopterin molybdotransferase MoeA [Deltaproteobacteria bacterium]
MTSSLLPFDDAVRAVLDAVAPLADEEVAATDATGRVLAEDVVAPEDLPRAAVSAMDGYALPGPAIEALAGGDAVALRVVGEVAAGSGGHPGPVGAREAVRIFTGAVVPAWAAAVVEQERCERSGDGVTVRGPVREAANVRPAGGDVRAGDPVLARGDVAGPPGVALLSALGVERVRVARRPAVAVVVTGSEIADGADLPPGRIRDSNGPALRAAAPSCGAGPVTLLRAADARDALASALGAALRDADLVCVSGGVSVGDHDLVKEVAEGLGVRRVFWGVAQRPGKPLYFGVFPGSLGPVPVLGLPGNPASSLACFLAYAWPAIRRVQGVSPECVRARAVLSSPARKPAGLAAMLRGRRRPGGALAHVEVAASQDSHLLLPFARADCLVLLPPGSAEVPAGTEVDVIPFPWA